MNDELKVAMEDLALTIQDLDLSEEAKAHHLKLIAEVIKNPTKPNFEALLVVLEATAKMDNIAIQGLIDDLKTATQF
jgi:hypothetical protein